MEWYDDAYGSYDLIDPMITGISEGTYGGEIDPYSFYEDPSTSIGGVEDLGWGGSNYSFVQDAGDGIVYVDNTTGMYTYDDGHGNLYALPDYGAEADANQNSAWSTGLNAVTGALGSNLGGLLGAHTVGDLAAAGAGSYLQNKANQQQLATQQQWATDWFNMNRAAELADQERMGVTKRLDMTIPPPRQLTDLSGVNFSTAGERPGGLSFFTDVRKG